MILVSNRLLNEIGPAGVDRAVVKFFSTGKEVEGVMVSACPLDGDLYKRPYDPKKQTMLEYIRQFPCSFCFQMKDEKANVFVATSPEFYQFKI